MHPDCLQDEQTQRQDGEDQLRLRGEDHDEAVEDVHRQGCDEELGPGPPHEPGLGHPVLVGRQPQGLVDDRQVPQHRGDQLQAREEQQQDDRHRVRHGPDPGRDLAQHRRRRARVHLGDHAQLQERALAHAGGGGLGVRNRKKWLNRIVDAVRVAGLLDRGLGHRGELPRQEGQVPAPPTR